MAILTGVYVILGGYMATAINDFIQGIVMLIGIVAVVVSVINGNGGFYTAYTNLSKLESDVSVTAGLNGAFTSFFGPDPINLLGVVILTSLGTWGLPQMVQKFYAIKDEKAIRTGTIISTFFAIVVAGGSYFLGGFGRLTDVSEITVDGKLAFDAIIPTMLSRLPDILIGVVVVLVLSASMSTLSSLVLTSSSTLTLDLIKGSIAKNMSEKKQVFVMRIFIVVFIVISVVIALDPPTFIAQLMGISWGALAGAFLAPLLYGLYWKGVTRAGVWAGFASGVGITVANMVGNWMSPINAGAIAMLAGLVVVPAVSLITPKLDKGEIDFSFKCYDKKKVIEEKIALPDDVVQE
jgi:SSS family solute:Na+ symporter